jgi:hypothetical protein
MSHFIPRILSLITCCIPLIAAEPSWEIISIYKADVAAAGEIWEKPIIESRAG